MLYHHRNEVGYKSQLIQKAINYAVLSQVTNYAKLSPLGTNYAVLSH